MEKRQDEAIRRTSWQPDDLTDVFGSAVPAGRAPRVLGLFAHPDDEVFCVGGTIARCAEAGAVTAIVSLTQGEAGQIREASTATRGGSSGSGPGEGARAVRGQALGVDDVTCLDLGDGHLAEQPLDVVAAAARTADRQFRPDVVVTFGPDGGVRAIPITSRRAWQRSRPIRGMPDPPRLLHARVPDARAGPRRRDRRVAHLAPRAIRRHRRVRSRVQAVRRRDVDARVRRRSPHVDWFPAGSFIIEQGEPATRALLHPVGLGRHRRRARRRPHAAADVTSGAGCFFGEDGLASGRPRNAHVIARDDVTCLVLAPTQPNRPGRRAWRSSRSVGRVPRLPRRRRTAPTSTTASPST